MYHIGLTFRLDLLRMFGKPESHMWCATRTSHSIKGRSVGVNAKLINYIDYVNASHK